jgi:glycosyltransferase involved in cell wall biosynthesis
MAKKIRIIVNAIPLKNVSTGISRYMRCLYTELENQYSDRLQIGYFDGRSVSAKMPGGPEDLKQWSRHVEMFWKLPAYAALLLRLVVHAKRERFFKRLSKDYQLYHEAGFFPFLVPPHVRTVFTLHDLSVLRFPEHHPRERVLYYRLFLRNRCRKVNHFLTVSRFSQQEMKMYLEIPFNKITVIYEAHDEKVFYPRPHREIEDVLALRGLPKKYFLFVGSGDPRKNLDVIPEALERAGLKVPLLIVGWQGWTNKGGWDNVIFLNYMDDNDLARLYSGALALIFPSTYEGFGLPLLEAMACGCPAVTTREASLPEVAGDSAIYMKAPRDVEDLAGILKNLAEKPALREKFTEKGLARAGKFSWKKTADATMQAFEKALTL